MLKRKKKQYNKAYYVIVNCLPYDILPQYNDCEGKPAELWRRLEATYDEKCKQERLIHVNKLLGHDE